jgi:hypothetical protein
MRDRLREEDESSVHPDVVLSVEIHLKRNATLPKKFPPPGEQLPSLAPTGKTAGRVSVAAVHLRKPDLSFGNGIKRHARIRGILV